MLVRRLIEGSAGSSYAHARWRRIKEFLPVKLCGHLDGMFSYGNKEADRHSESVPTHSAQHYALGGWERHGQTGNNQSRVFPQQKLLPRNS
jgi:hypothetical protein